jgi:hypothetical protein
MQGSNQTASQPSKQVTSTNQIKTISQTTNQASKQGSNARSP